jgi:hypothetical protein
VLNPPSYNMVLLKGADTSVCTTLRIKHWILEYKTIITIMSPLQGLGRENALSCYNYATHVVGSIEASIASFIK